MPRRDNSHCARSFAKRRVTLHLTPSEARLVQGAIDRAMGHSQTTEREYRRLARMDRYIDSLFPEKA